MKLTIFTESGDYYTIVINIPTGTEDIDAYISDWIDANLRGVSGYRRH